MRIFIATCIGSLVSIAASAGPIAKPGHYELSTVSVHDLDPGGDRSYGYGISDTGVVVGHVVIGTGIPYGFRSDAGVMTTIPGARPSNSSDEFANGINVSGVAIGRFQGGVPGGEQSFYHVPGATTWQYLDGTVQGLEYQWTIRAESINDSGQIVGYARRSHNSGGVPPSGPTACYDSVPIIWDSSTAQPRRLFCLKDTDGDGIADGTGVGVSAYDINEAGTVVGADSGTSTYSMFLWKNGVRTSVPPPGGVSTTDLLGSRLHGQARGVNVGERVVGVYGRNQNSPNFYPVGHAFYWDGSSAKSQDLGTVRGGRYSIAYRINDDNFVVGTSEANNGSAINPKYAEVGFLWHPDFGLAELPALSRISRAEPRECQAAAISQLRESGLLQIAGTCKFGPEPYPHAVRWDVMVKWVPATIVTSPQP